MLGSPHEPVPILLDVLRRAADFGDDPPDWMETRMEVDPESIAARLDSDLANVFPDDHGKPAGDLLKQIVEAVQAFAQGAEQYDDVTALVVRYLGPGRGTRPA